MALEPAKYGKVVGRFVAIVADGPDEDEYASGGFPDVMPMKGTVTFTPYVSKVLVAEAQPAPATAFPIPITVPLDENGYLSWNGKPGVFLLCPSEATNPPEFTYRVRFNFEHDGRKVSTDEFPIELVEYVPGPDPEDPDAGSTAVDLTLVSPVYPSAGQPIVRGIKGDTIDRIELSGDGGAFVFYIDRSTGVVAETVVIPALGELNDAVGAAEAARDAAATSASAAAGSATSASNAASAASGSASDAATDRAAAQSAASSASGSATAAADSASAAAGSASTANSHRSAAQTARNAAEGFRDNAASSATAAAGSASNAAGSATTASNAASTATTQANRAESEADRAEQAANDAAAGVVPDGAITDPKVAPNAEIAQSKIAGLVDDLAGKSPTGHTHGIGDVSGLQTALNGKSATGHTHAIGDVSGLQTALNGKAPSSHTHTPTQIDGSTPTGRSVLTASNAGTARDTIGAAAADMLPELVTSLPASPVMGKLYCLPEE